MAPAIFLVLLGLCLGVLNFLGRLDMSNEVRLAGGIIGGIGALVVPIWLYSIIDLKLTRNAVARVGREWCAGSKVDFMRVEMHKNHYSVIYRSDHSRKNERRNFRIRFALTTWFVKSVEWL